jgi:hypothetical protein
MRNVGKSHLLLACALLAVRVGGARAQDASFGCKVLLCAAAVSPSWSGIPYCVAPMTQLLRSLARGGGWPSCPEGNTGGLGYQPYLACPVGAQSYSQARTDMETGSGGNPNGGATTYVVDPNGGLCLNPSDIPASCAASGAGSDACAAESVAVASVGRSANPDPYFVDIAPQNSTPFRFFFNLANH